MTEQETYTIPELSKAWGVSLQAVYQLLKSRGCPIHGTRRKYYVLGADLEEHLLSRPGQYDLMLARATNLEANLGRRVRRLELQIIQLQKELRDAKSRKSYPSY